MLWLVRGLSKQHAPSEGHVQRWVDSREIAGRFARDALWSMLSNKDKKERVTGGEPAMVETMAQGLMNDASLPNAAKEWIDACRQGIAKLRLNNDGPQTRSLDDLERELPKHITLSQPLFVTKHDYDTRIREAIRTLEYERPFVGLIDAAVMPRMLSYPHPSCAERYVVPHRDPDHWGRQPSGQWVPLSSTAYAAWDEERWVQLLIISPHPYDYNNIGHIEDRLRTECRRLGVLPRELMPNPEGGHSDGSGGRKN